MALTITKATPEEVLAIKAEAATNPNFIERGKFTFLVQVPKTYRKMWTYDGLNGILYTEEKTW